MTLRVRFGENDLKSQRYTNASHTCGVINLLCRQLEKLLRQAKPRCTCSHEVILSLLHLDLESCPIQSYAVQTVITMFV